MLCQRKIILTKINILQVKLITVVTLPLTLKKQENLQKSITETFSQTKAVHNPTNTQVPLIAPSFHSHCLFPSQLYQINLKQIQAKIYLMT